MIPKNYPYSLLRVLEFHVIRRKKSKNLFPHEYSPPADSVIKDPVIEIPDDKYSNGLFLESNATVSSVCPTLATYYHPAS